MSLRFVWAVGILVALVFCLYAFVQLDGQNWLLRLMNSSQQSALPLAEPPLAPPTAPLFIALPAAEPPNVTANTSVLLSAQTSTVPATASNLTLAHITVATSEKSHWFAVFLHSHGARIIPASFEMRKAYISCQGILSCYQGVVHRYIFKTNQRNPRCEYFYLHQIGWMSWEAALTMPRRKQGIILGGSSSGVMCNKGRYNKKLTLGAVSLADLIITDSDRSANICHQGRINTKMLNLGEYYNGDMTPTRKLIATRRSEIELRHLRRSRNDSTYIIGLGKQNRDYDTVLDALEGLAVTLKIAGGGGKRSSNAWDTYKGLNERCYKSPQCEFMPVMSRSQLDEVINHALFVAVPVGKCSCCSTQCPNDSVVGLTGLIEAVTHGKAVVMTDRGEGLHTGSLINGTTGFLVGLYDVLAWRRVTEHLLRMDRETLRAYELASIGMADIHTRENISQRFLSATVGLRRRGVAS